MLHEHYAETASDALSCYFSEKGCRQLPVRMVGERRLGGLQHELDIVLLCPAHSAVYVCTKAVIDEPITQEFIEAVKSAGRIL